MARPNKIEQYQLQHIVARCLSEGTTSVRKIAAECTRFIRDQGIKDEVSPAAVHRYIEASKYDKPAKVEEKKAAVTRIPERVERIVNFDFDIIDLQYRTTTALLERFNFMVELPTMFDVRMTELQSAFQQPEVDADYLHRWKVSFLEDLRRNVQNVAILNRELRENSKFMADLREKAFEFKLWKEFTDLFIDAFRQRAPEACDLVLQDIALNPRMQRIIEMQMKGETA